MKSRYRIVETVQNTEYIVQWQERFYLFWCIPICYWKTVKTGGHSDLPKTFSNMKVARDYIIQEQERELVYPAVRQIVYDTKDDTTLNPH